MTLEQLSHTPKTTATKRALLLNLYRDKVSAIFFRLSAAICYSVARLIRSRNTGHRTAALRWVVASAFETGAASLIAIRP